MLAGCRDIELTPPILHVSSVELCCYVDELKCRTSLVFNANLQTSAVNSRQAAVPAPSRQHPCDDQHRDKSYNLQFSVLLDHPGFFFDSPQARNRILPSEVRLNPRANHLYIWRALPGREAPFFQGIRQEFGRLFYQHPPIATQRGRKDFRGSTFKHAEVE
jgi:hypothetical protein